MQGRLNDAVFYFVNVIRRHESGNRYSTHYETHDFWRSTNRHPTRHRNRMWLSLPYAFSNCRTFCINYAIVHWLHVIKIHRRLLLTLFRCKSALCEKTTTRIRRTHENEIPIAFFRRAFIERIESKSRGIFLDVPSSVHHISWTCDVAIFTDGHNVCCFVDHLVFLVRLLFTNYAYVASFPDRSIVDGTRNRSRFNRLRYEIAIHEKHAHPIVFCKQVYLLICLYVYKKDVCERIHTSFFSKFLFKMMNSLCSYIFTFCMLK